MGLTLNSFIPPGMLKPHAGSTIPTGYLACDGSAVSRNGFSALFSAIGTTFGSGDGSTTFNLPDLRGRGPIGDGTGAGLSTRNRGELVGQETFNLTSANLPAHTHGVGTLSNASTNIDSHSHGVSTSTSFSDLSHSHSVNDPGHIHPVNVGAGLQTGVPYVASGSNSSGSANTSVTYTVATGISVNGVGLNHQHSFSTTSATTSGTSHSHTLSGSTDNGGFSGMALTIVQPSLCVKFVIKY